MRSVLFVHGTGVREAAYGRSFEQIASALKARPDLTPVRCYWGALGARLNAGGLSIPSYATARAIELGGELPPSGDVSLELWALLYRDPLFELTALSLSTEDQEDLPPSVLPPGLEFARQGRSFAPSRELRAKLAEAGISEVFSGAQTTVTASEAYHEALSTASSALAEYRLAVARAWVAEAIVQGEEKNGYSPPVRTDARQRDELVNLLVNELGGREYGVGHRMSERLKKFIFRLGSRLGTSYAQQRRGALTDAAHPAAGDVLLYQSRGTEIRAFIRDCIRSTPSPVVLLAHSLGGIACVDLLIEEPMAVELLITVGSQVAFLYEIGALHSLPFGNPLPERFPHWMNLYDPRDFLSYVGEGVFAGKVRDHEVDNHQPFPEAHGAYWKNSAVWREIFRELG